MADVIGAGKFLRSELAQYDSTLYATQYPEYWLANGKYHRSRGDLMLGVRELVSGRVDFVGAANIYDGKSTDIPLSDFGITEDRYKARVIISGAQWNVFDLAANEAARRNALLPQRDFVSLKMDAMKQSIDRRVHELGVYGSTPQAMNGMFSGAQVEIKSISTDVYALSADDLYQFFLDEIGDFRRDSKLTAEVTGMLVPEAINIKLARRFTANADGTPRLLLTSADRGMSVQNIIPVNELESAYLEANGVQSSGTNKDRIMLGSLDDERTLLRQFYPMDRTEVTLAPDGITYQVTGYTAVTEMQFRTPYKVRYLDIPKAA
jgi:hypothetical protein